MSLDLSTCETQALRLPPADRATLAERLIASLDTLDEAQIERLWLEEADRRYAAYKTGTISARLAQDVLSDARAAIK